MSTQAHLFAPDFWIGTPGSRKTPFPDITGNGVGVVHHRTATCELCPGPLFPRTGQREEAGKRLGVRSLRNGWHRRRALSSRGTRQVLRGIASAKRWTDDWQLFGDACIVSPCFRHDLRSGTRTRRPFVICEPQRTSHLSDHQSNGVSAQTQIGVQARTFVTACCVFSAPWFYRRTAASQISKRICAAVRSGGASRPAPLTGLSPSLLAKLPDPRDFHLLNAAACCARLLAANCRQAFRRTAGGLCSVGRCCYYSALEIFCQE